MKSALELRLANSEGVLERVLGCLRQRGFELCSLEMERSSDTAHFIVRCEVESPRPIETVCRQLTRLFDVQSVKVQRTDATAVEGYVLNEKSKQREICLTV
jgi:acetolactate synthase regulatory subunit